MDRILSPLELAGWLEFNAWRTGLAPHPFSLAVTPDGPEVRAVMYLDRRGRVKLPRGNPYLPVSFRSARQRPSGRTAEWHEVAASLVDEMRRRGSGNQLYLSPDVQDVRPWLWRGFFVSVRYTYYLDFPFDDTVMDREKRRARDKAVGLGMSVERVTSVEPVIACLAETEARQGFTQGLGPRELHEARRLLGDDSLRMYVCFDRAGHPASTEVILHSAGARAIAWAAGTKSARLRDGAGHLVLLAAFDDLLADGAIGIDLCGANMPSVAKFKSHWGARLVTNFGVRTYSLRTGARILAEWLASRSR
jgi:hypothetical protein